MDAGIKLYNVSNSKLINNNYSYNFNGIMMYNSDNNTISRNIVNDNSKYGIYLNDGNENNTISGNIVNNNSKYGVYLNDGSDNNTILGNILNDNHLGCYYEINCDDNEGGDFIWVQVVEKREKLRFNRNFKRLF